MWRVFRKKNNPKIVILAVDQETRRIVVERMPTSQKALIDALLEYWRDNELPFSIAEVLRYEKPQHVFYAVKWISGDDDDSTAAR